MLFTLIAHRGVKSDWKTDIEKRNVFNLIKIHKFLQRRLFWFLQYRNMHVCSCKMIIITWLQDFSIIWAALSSFLQYFKCAWKQCMHAIFLGTGFLSFSQALSSHWLRKSAVLIGWNHCGNLFKFLFRKIWIIRQFHFFIWNYCFDNCKYKWAQQSSSIFIYIWCSKDCFIETLVGHNWWVIFYDSFHSKISISVVPFLVNVLQINVQDRDPRKVSVHIRTGPHTSIVRFWDPYFRKNTF